jgi:hypothetical protein
MSLQHRSRDVSKAHPERAVAATVLVALAAIVTVAPASIAQSDPGATAQASPQSAVPAGETIPLSSLADLASLEATATIEADGTLDGKPMQGDLTATLITDAQGSSQVDITGSLLGPVTAQIGGKLVGLFRPKKVTVYSVPDGTYVVVSGLTSLCVKLGDPAATEALAQLSPQGLMATLTSSDVARGTLVGEETIDGMPVSHWVIDGEAFLAGASASSDPTVVTFAQALTQAADADLYVATDSGFPVSYRGSFSGAYAPLALEGDFSVAVDLTGIDTDPTVTLPGSCDRPIAM